MAWPTYAPTAAPSDGAPTTPPPTAAQVGRSGRGSDDDSADDADDGGGRGSGGRDSDDESAADDGGGRGSGGRGSDDESADDESAADDDAETHARNAAAWRAADIAGRARSRFRARRLGVARGAFRPVAADATLPPLFASAGRRVDACVVAALLGARALDPAAPLFAAAASPAATGALRAVCALRPLLLASHLPGLSAFLGALKEASKALAALCGVLLLFLYAYAILGMQLFQGSFATCSDADFPPGGPHAGVARDAGAAALIPLNATSAEAADAAAMASWAVFPCANGQDPSGAVDNATGAYVFDAPHEAEVADYNYDSFGHAAVASFVVLSMSGLGGLAEAGVDAVGEAREPQQDARPEHAWYFLLGGLFFGVCVVRARARRDGSPSLHRAPHLAGIIDAVPRHQSGVVLPHPAPRSSQVLHVHVRQHGPTRRSSRRSSSGPAACR